MCAGQNRLHCGSFLLIDTCAPSLFLRYEIGFLSKYSMPSRGLSINLSTEYILKEDWRLDGSMMTVSKVLSSAR